MINLIVSGYYDKILPEIVSCMGRVIHKRLENKVSRRSASFFIDSM